VLGLVEGRVAKEGTDGREPHVATPSTVATSLLDVVKEGADQRRVEILETQRRGGPSSVVVPQIQGAAKRYRGSSRLCTGSRGLLDEPIEEERLEKQGKVGGNRTEIQVARSPTISALSQPGGESIKIPGRLTTAKLLGDRRGHEVREHDSFDGREPRCFLRVATLPDNAELSQRRAWRYRRAQ
jgi:hypothetical protein